MDRKAELDECETIFRAVEDRHKSKSSSSKGGPRGRTPDPSFQKRVDGLVGDSAAVEHLRRQMIVLRRECDIDDASQAGWEKGDGFSPFSRAS